MKFNNLLSILFAFAFFFADDPNGGGKPDDDPQDPPQDPPADPTPKDDVSELKALLEKERTAREELENKIAQRERAEAEKKGEWEKLYKESKEKWETKEKNFILSQSVNAFKAEAVKQGCTNADDLAALYQKDIRKLEVDTTTFMPSGNKLSELVSHAKEAKSFFFNKPAPKTDDIPPRKPSQEDYMTEIKKCKTQKEFDEVRRKYGRI